MKSKEKQKVDRVIGHLLPADSEVRIWVGGKLMYVKVPPRRGDL
ncbi:MAG TPA: hypothetical protein VJG83_06430 [archaeon]|nr:hypothetical protein [archaeon]